MDLNRAAAVALAALLLPVSAVAAAGPARAAKGPDRPAVERSLRSAADRVLSLRHDASGDLSFVGTTPGHPVRRAAGVSADASPEAKARGFVATYGTAFGVARPSADLRVGRVSPVAGGGSVVRLAQVADGLPVLGGEVVVSLDAQGGVVSAAAQTSAAGATPAQVTADTARATALGVSGRAHAGSRDLTADEPVLSVYDPAVLGVPGGGPARTVWRTTVTGLAVRDLVLIDAATGGVALKVDQLLAAEARRVCDFNQVRTASETCSATDAARVKRTEGQPATALADVDQAYDNAGFTYDFYSGVLGRDSVDGQGLPLTSTVRFCPSDVSSGCPYQNAFWNGRQMVYGTGYAGALDVVAHELTHGVTQYTSGLYYLYQPGAINESMSDVMGELVEDWHTGGGADGLLGEQLAGGPIRSMSSPTLYGQPDRMTSSRYETDLGFGDNGGVHTNSGVGNKAAWLILRGGTFNGHTSTALGATKTAHVYYLAEQQLTAGAGYAQLASVLPAACDALVGQDGITTVDCDSVREAVAATEMATPPPAATPRVAPVLCAPGTTATTLAADDMEPRTGSTAAQRWSAAGYWTADSARDAEPYASSGANSLFGYDVGSASDTVATQVTGTLVPAGRTTWLRFTHAYNLDWDPAPAGESAPRWYDGGRVEYSLDGGGWDDVASLFSAGDNGYDRTITGVHNGAYAGGFAGFGGDSHGFVTTRLNVSRLGGHTVRFRFRLTTDDEIGYYGWYVDDVQLVACDGPVPSAAVGVSATGISPTSAVVRWSPPGWTGASAVTGYDVQATPLVGSGVSRSLTVGPTVRSVTLSRLTATTGYRVTVTPVNASGPGATTVRSLAAARLLATFPAAITAGTVLSVPGSVVRRSDGAPVPGQKVWLQSRPAGSTGPFRSLQMLTTMTNGGYQFTVRPTASAQYRIRFFGSGTALGTDDLLRTVAVRWQVVAALSSSTVSRGAPVTVSGSVRPANAGHRVYLQRWYGSAWHDVVSMTLTSRSTYSTTIRRSTSGLYSYRVRVPKDATHQANVSATRTLRVR